MSIWHSASLCRYLFKYAFGVGVSVICPPSVLSPSPHCTCGNKCGLCHHGCSPRDSHMSRWNHLTPLEWEDEPGWKTAIWPLAACGRVRCSECGHSFCGNVAGGREGAIRSPWKSSCRDCLSMGCWGGHGAPSRGQVRAYFIAHGVGTAAPFKRSHCSPYCHRTSVKNHWFGWWHRVHKYYINR